MSPGAGSRGRPSSAGSIPPMDAARADEVARAVSGALEFDVEGVTRRCDEIAAFAPAGLSPAESMRISVRMRGDRVSADLATGRFSRGLLEDVAAAGEAAWGNLWRVEEAITSDGGRATVIVDGRTIARGSVPAAPSRAIELRVRGPVLAGADPGPAAALDMTRRSIGMLLCLLPDPGPEVADADADAGDPEGALRRMTADRHERSRANRAACIAAHGTRCAACGFSSEETYGPDAAGRIHVHHVVPLADMDAEARVDPVRDLVPVCPNCHDVIHMSRPPLTVAEVGRMIAGARRARDAT